MGREGGNDTVKISLEGSEARMAWQAVKGESLTGMVLSRRDLNFCVRITSLH